MTYENYEWLMIAATIAAGTIQAIATLVAVILTNRETRRQLIHQQEIHKKELSEQDKINNHVVLKPTLVLMSFVGMLDKLIVQNDYNRELVLSGEDGFGFFDDIEKRNKQLCRLFEIENPSENDIKDIVIRTESFLEDKNSNEVVRYSTENAIKLLRPRERFVIRIANQSQYEKILHYNKEGIPNELVFDCFIEYSTLSGQRIQYHYKVRVINDRIIEIVNDGIEKETADISEITKATPFRNLQDYISGIDRSAYVWEKMGQSQVKGIMSIMNMPANQQNGGLVQTIDTAEKEGDADEQK